MAAKRQVHRRDDACGATPTRCAGRLRAHSTPAPRMSACSRSIGPGNMAARDKIIETLGTSEHHVPPCASAREVAR
jgi:hypothetical protein